MTDQVLTRREKLRLTRLLREHRKLAGGYTRPSILVSVSMTCFTIGGSTFSCPFWPVGAVLCQRSGCRNLPYHARQGGSCRLAASPGYGEATSLWKQFLQTEPLRFRAWARREGLKVVE